MFLERSTYSMREGGSPVFERWRLDKETTMAFTHAKELCTSKYWQLQRVLLKLRQADSMINTRNYASRTNPALHGHWAVASLITEMQLMKIAVAVWMSWSIQNPAPWPILNEHERQDRAYQRSHRIATSPGMDTFKGSCVSESRKGQPAVSKPAHSSPGVAPGSVRSAEHSPVRAELSHAHGSIAETRHSSQHLAGTSSMFRVPLSECHHPRDRRSLGGILRWTAGTSC